MQILTAPTKFYGVGRPSQKSVEQPTLPTLKEFSMAYAIACFDDDKFYGYLANNLLSADDESSFFFTDVIEEADRFETVDIADCMLREVMYNTEFACKIIEVD